MKTMFTSIIAGILIFNSYAQDWNILNEGGNFHTIDFVNDKVGWIGGDGTLIKTEDGGETWIKLPFEENWEIRHIDFIDELLGWASGSAWDTRVLLKSIDGGQTWSIQEEMQDRLFRQLQAIDDNVIYAIEYYSNDDDYGYIIWKTVDGGSNWIDISPDLTDKSLATAWFFNREVGIITGIDYRGGYPGKGLILRTVNGGTTWEEIILPEFEGIGKLQFINDSTGFCIAGSDDKYLFCSTTDTGRTWTIRTEKSYRIGFFFAINENIIYAAMSDSVMKSADGGITWTSKFSSRTFLYFNNFGWELKIFFNNENLGFLITPGLRSIWRITDNGDDWNLQKFSYPLSGTFFLNKDKGFAFGGWRGGGHMRSYGDVFTTEDGGETWRLSLTKNMPPISCFFTDEHTGFLPISNTPPNSICLYKTENSGETWEPLSDFYTDSTSYHFPYDIYFSDDQNGWITGNYNCTATIWGTKDGGKNWDTEWTYKDTTGNWTPIPSIYFIDSTGWAVVGTGGMVLKYTRQNQWQLQPTVTDLPLNDVFFSDQQHGWIAGGYLNSQGSQSILLKTKDAGKNWAEKRFDKYLINDLYFSDSLHGWAVGNDTTDTGQWPPGQGAILETKDGGDNWIPVVENLSARLNAIHFKEGVGWAVGGNGLVLRTDNWVDWIDQSTGKIYPDNFSLSQNYPNPFNPVTNIRYTVGAKDFSPLQVNLSIYNILGQKVATLVNKKQPAGSYQVQWDASGFASGIYVYRIQAGDFVQTKRMLLIK